MSAHNFPDNVYQGDPLAPWNQDSMGWCESCGEATDHVLRDGGVQCEWQPLHEATDLGDLLESALHMARHEQMSLTHLHDQLCHHLEKKGVSI